MGTGAADTKGTSHWSRMTDDLCMKTLSLDEKDILGMTSKYLWVWVKKIIITFDLEHSCYLTISSIRERDFKKASVLHCYFSRILLLLYSYRCLSLNKLKNLTQVQTAAVGPGQRR